MDDNSDGHRRDYRAALRSFLLKRSDQFTVAGGQAQAGEVDRALWRTLCTELGAGGLSIPKKYGGQGGDALDRAITFEELGRALAPTPHLCSALAGESLLRSEDASACETYLPGLSSGDLVATLPLPGGEPAAATYRRAEGVVVDGTLTWAPHGFTADLVLFVAAGDDGDTLMCVPLPAPRVTRRRLETLDLTRPMAEIRLDGATALAVGRPGDGGAARRRLEATALACIAAEQAGGARAMLEASVAHARTRRQFGRPIGSFQAVKHLCADMLVQVESADAAANAAAAALDRASMARELSPDATRACHLAGAVCGEAYAAVAAVTIQLHGGIGYTWEHPAHLHYRRAWLDSLILGSPAEHRELVLQGLIDDLTAVAERTPGS